VGVAPDPEGVALARRCMAAVPEAAYRAAIRCLVGFDRRDALVGYRMPVLLIAGGRDTSAPEPMMRRMAERIPGSRLAAIEAAGHLANLEQPAAFNRLLDEHLAPLAGA
jgi:pimeloyl-ACP methyl ester carboxylesterase